MDITDCICRTAFGTHRRDSQKDIRLLAYCAQEAGRCYVGAVVGTFEDAVGPFLY